MLKKIKDLTVGEMKDICDNCDICSNCPLSIPNPTTCILNLVERLKEKIEEKIDIKVKEDE